MALLRVLLAVLALTACGGEPRRARLPDDVRARSAEYSRLAAASFAAGEREAAFRLATRALVARIAACGLDCPEVAESFVQLGDLRQRNGQREWAAQSYRRALEILEPHATTHRAWIDATRARLESVRPVAAPGDAR